MIKGLALRPKTFRLKKIFFLSSSQAAWIWLGCVEIFAGVSSPPPSGFKVKSRAIKLEWQIIDFSVIGERVRIYNL